MGDGWTQDSVLSEISQICIQILHDSLTHEVPKIGEFTETDSRIDVTSGYGKRGRMSYNFMGTKFVERMVKKFVYRKWGWLTNIMNVFNATELDTYE